ncbi:MAG: hypothetical protein EOM64_01935 [Erysipelotrichia bacterium]|nr:hypothetical protein [Erysipelotrichia bacterium]
MASVLMLGGCSSGRKTSSAVPSVSADATVTAVSGIVTGYENYAAALGSVKVADSYSAGVKCSYDMKYSDGSVQTYDLDGVLQVQNISSAPAAHMTQNINGNGMESAIDGFYYDGRLYNTYNNVTYYEDMEFSDLKSAMLVPIDAVSIKREEIQSITSVQTDNGMKYSIALKPEAAQSYFNNRYDFNSLKGYDNFAVNSGMIAQTFSEDGYLMQQTADFAVSLSSGNVTVDVTYSSSVGFVKSDSTSVTVSDTQKTAFAKYVNYRDIDTDAISPKDTSSDAEEATVTATFQKRLVNRLDYTKESDSSYKTSFNDTESYTIDFANDIFTYTNRSSSYTYNWKGDTGGFGNSCNYNFETDSSMTGCDSDVLDMVKNVKTFFEMELYYCGLSLDDLAAEVRK